MLILDIVNDFCQSSSGLSVVLILKYGLIILQVAAPIILIVMLMVTFTKAITSGSGKEDALSKAFHEAGNKAIACIMVFLCSTAVLMLTNLIGATKFSDSLSCWGSNVTVESINLMREAEKAKKKADAQAAIDAAKAKQELQDSSSGSTGGGTSVPWDGAVKNGEKVGNVVRYKQCSYKIPGDINICSSGCGSTSVAMIASGLMGTKYDPAYVANIAISSGNLKKEGMSPSGVHALGEKLGLTGDILFETSGASYYSSVSNKIMLDAVSLSKESKQISTAILQDNKQVVLGVPGHFLVLDKSSKSGKIHLVNPAGTGIVEKNSTYYPTEGDFTISELFEAIKDYNSRCIDGWYVNGELRHTCGWRNAVAFKKY
ncbi:MAG: hypothetical protein RSB41_00920 [Bacilli bacterium]